MSTNYRHPTLSDAAGIARVHVDCWISTYTGIIIDEYLQKLPDSYQDRRKMWEGIITKNPQRMWLAERAEQVIGFSSFGPSRYPEHPFDAELYAIYLLKEYQGQGIGKSLFQKSTQSLISEGHKSMLLWVLADNPTVRFYKGMGGEYLTTIKEEIGGTELDEEAYGWKSL